LKRAYSTIPKVDVILNESALSGLTYSKDIIKMGVLRAIEDIRASIESGRTAKSPDAAQIASIVAHTIQTVMEGRLKGVINATGVIVHTNLGRAPLAKEAIDAITDVTGRYCNLEYDLEKASRGSRQDHIRGLAAHCFGSEDALVVNNNAAAVLIALATMADGKEVIVSRGELVEIGGSFRMPDVMASSGAILKEIGTTNKTKLSDYEEAITEDTALIMKVHQSNFAIVGFTEDVSIKELAGLAHRKGLPLFVDMGSGIPFSLDDAGIHDEWTIKGCLSQGADIVSFSGDKVLGGPQAGIILGRQDLISSIAKNPLHRAIRIDKLTIAALAATLRLLAKGRSAAIPVLRMIYEPLTDVEKKAAVLRDSIGFPDSKVIPTNAVIGGGAAPTKSIPSFGVVISTPKAEEIYSRLRQEDPPVISRIEEASLIFDMRTVDDSQIDPLADSIKRVLADAI